ncbi:MAG: DNA topoisomerase, partial [Candidatus Micrarchaeaceae archaeon]
MKLVIAEKPSVGMDFAKALGIKDKKDGYIVANGDYTITWAVGHLVEIDDSIAPQKWELETLPIIPSDFKYKPNEKTIKQLKVIKDLVKQAEEIIISTDAGREGELIARLILNTAGWKNWDKTYRFWTSQALTKEVIQKELKSVKPSKEYDSLYFSALARQHSDWVVGINLTRLITIKAGNGVWSVGRVQTPILRLIVERDLAIENFKPEEYYTIKGLFKTDKYEYEGFLRLDNKAVKQDNKQDNDEEEN